MANLPTYVAKGTFASGTGAISPGIPAGLVNDDIMILLVESANQAITAPTGWVEVGSQATQSTGTAAAAGGVRLGVFWKVYGGLEAAPSVADTGDHTTGIIIGVRGADPINPFHLTGSSAAAASTSMTWPTFTTTVANCLILMLTAVDTDAASTTNVGAITAASLASIAEIHDESVISGAGGGVHAAWATKATAGALGTITATASTSVTHAYLTLAVQGTEPVVRTVGQYKNDQLTIVPVGGATGTDGISNEIFLKAEYSAGNRQTAVTPKYEKDTVATSFSNTADASMAALTQSDVTNPARALRGTTMVYDDVNKRLVSFGGYDGTTRYNEVWHRFIDKPGQPWRKMTVSGTPPGARNLHSSTFLKANLTSGGATRAYMMVWGGFTTADQNDMWLLRLDTVGSEAWTQVTETSAPTAREYTSGMLVAGDSPNSHSVYVYLFGGWATSRENQLVRCTIDVDAPTTTTWTTLKANGAVGNPTIRSGGIMAYKASTSKLYLYGGYSGTAMLNDFWEYDIAGNSWTNTSPTGTAPTASETAAGGYDPVNNRFWFTGGWTTNGTFTTSLNQIGYISNVGGAEAYNIVRANATNSGNQAYTGHSFSGFAIDTQRNMLYIKNMADCDPTTDMERYGYIIDFAETASTDFPVYSENEGEFLTARDAPATIYDPVAREWLMIGGFDDMYNDTTIANGTHSNDVWAYNATTNTWRYANAGFKGLPQCEGRSAVYDTTRNRIILFGGLTGIGMNNNETWTLTRDSNGDYVAAPLAPTGTKPGVRWLQAAVYDPTNDRMVIAMGGNSSGPINDVWELSFTSSAQGVWTQRTPSGSATAVVGMGFADKASAKRLYMFGGATVANLSTVNSQTAYLDYSTTSCAWTVVTTSGAVARRTPACAYDAGMDRLVVFGGYNGSASIQALGWLNLATTTWEVPSTTTTPDARRSTIAAFINGAFYMTHGRSDSGGWYRNTWKLQPDYITINNSVWTNLYPDAYNSMYYNVTGLTTSTGYHWQAWATEGSIDSPLVSYGNNAESVNDLYVGTPTVSAPTVTSSAVGTISFGTAVANGNVTADGNGAITERGFVLALQASADPTTGTNVQKIVVNNGTTGAFSGTFTNLDPNVAYKYRPYAINSAGTSYGSAQNFTSEDYKTFTAYAVMQNTGGGTTYLTLWNRTDNTQVAASEMSTTSASPVLIKQQFAYNASNFLDAKDYEFRMKVSSGSTGNVYSAGLYVKLHNLTKATSYNRVSRFGFQALSAAAAATTQRFLYTAANYSSPSADWIITGTEDTNGTNNFQLYNVTTTDSGTTGSGVAGTTIDVNSTSKVWSSVTGVTLVDTNRYLGIFNFTSGGARYHHGILAITASGAANTVETATNIELLDTARSSQLGINYEPAASRTPFSTTHFDGATYYFETVSTNSHASNAYGTTLVAYNAAGTATDVVTVNSAANTGASNVRNRSASITIPTDTVELRVRIAGTAASKNVVLGGARVVAVQTNATQTLVHIPMGGSNNESNDDAIWPIVTTNQTTYSTLATNVDQFTIWRRDDTKFADYYEVTSVATYTVTHSTDANKKKQNLIVAHTSDANRRKAFSIAHTTSSNFRKAGILKTHTTDSFLRKQFTKTHTTDANKRKATLVQHTTDANKKKSGLTVSHTTDANKKKSGVLKTHTTDSFLRKQFTKTHTTDANKKKSGNVVTHTTDSNKKKSGNTVSHTTSANKKKVGNVLSHTTDANLRFTFGTTHIAGAIVGGLANTLVATKYTLPRNGKIQKLTSWAATSGNQKGAIFADNSGSPGARLVVQNTTTAVTGGQFNDIDLPDTYLPAGTYWLAILDDTASVREAIAAGAGSNMAAYNSSQTYSSGIVDPFPTPSFQDYDYEVFATYLPASQPTLTHTTDANKRKATTVTHTTDAYTHTGVSTFTRTHTTDALKRKQFTLTHTTDANKKKSGNTVSHTTSANKRKATTVFHTTDANKKKSGLTVSHTTDALKRQQFVKTHTTDANKKKSGLTVSHTTDANKKKSGNTRTHTTDAFLRKQVTKTHTTDANKRKATTVSHTTDSNKKKSGLTVSHTTDANKKKAGFTLTHTTDSFKRGRYTVSHTTDSNKKKSGLTVSHTTDANKKKSGFTLTHTTDSKLRKQFTKTHTTDANKRKATLVTHTTDANKKKSGNTVTHTTDAYRRHPLLETLSDNFNDNSIASFWDATGFSNGSVTETNSRMQLTLNSGASGFDYAKLATASGQYYDMRGSYLRWKNVTLPNNNEKIAYVYVTIGVSRAVLWQYQNGTIKAIYSNPTNNVLYSATYSSGTHLYLRIRESGGVIYFDSSGDGSSWTQQASQTPAGTLFLDAVYAGFEIDPNGTTTSTGSFYFDDVNIGKITATVSHTTDSMLRKQNTITHTTDSNKRKALSVTHTTDSNKKKSGNTVSHTTDALKRKATLVNHTTDALKRKATLVTHTTDANKKKAGNTVSHTTSANLKKSGVLKTHTTDSFLRKQFTKTHTTDANKRKALAVTHTTDSNKKKTTTVSHTTDANKKVSGNTRTHTTDALKRKVGTVSHTTDANKKKAGNLKTHTTDALKRKQFTVTHTTDAYLSLTATIGPNNPGTATDSGSGFDAWTNTGNVFTSNDAYSTVTMGFNASFSNFLKVSNFGFTVPAGATINGIKVEIERKGNSTITDKSIQLMKSLTAGGTDKADTITTWPASDAYATYGSTSDLWGQTWTVNEINNSGFGVSIQAKETGGFNTASVDHVRISVTYTPGIPKVQHTTDANKKKAGNVLTHTTDSNKKKSGLTVSHTTDAFRTALSLSGPRSPGTTAGNVTGVGTVDWTSPGSIVSSDDTYATVGPNPFDTVSHYLKGSNFGFALPSTATVRGIVVEIERHASANGTNNVTDNSVKIVKSDGTIGTTNKADTVTKWPTTDAYVSYGSSSDLWGLSWAYSDINDIDFGAVLAVNLNYDTSVTAFVDHMRITVYYTTPIPTFTKTHTTDSLLRKQVTKVHTTDANKKKAGNLVSHTTDANKKKSNTISHTTDANKRKAGLTVTHTTSANKRKATTVTHTTDSYKSKPNFTVTHTTDALKTPGTVTTTSYFYTLASGDDAQQVISTGAVSTTIQQPVISGLYHVGYRFPGITLAQGLTITKAVLQTENYASGTDNFTGGFDGVTVKGQAIDNAPSFTTTTNDISGRSVTTATGQDVGPLTNHIWGDLTTAGGLDVTTIVQELLNRGGWASGNAMAILFKGSGTETDKVTVYHWDYFSGNQDTRLAITYTTVNARAMARPHTTDALLKKRLTATHTTDSYKRQVGVTRSHTTDALKRKTNTVSHTTDSLKRTSPTKTHTTDALLRKQITKTHTTDANLKKSGVTRTHTTDANKKKANNTVVHTTDALKRIQNTKVHTTDALKRKQFTLTHSTDSLLRKQSIKTHTTDANKRKALTVSHTTDANKKKAGLTLTHTTDANKKKAALTRTHTTDALLRKQVTKTHTTDALKRIQTVKTHTTDALKRTQNVKTHTTDANRRKALTVTHTTDANKKKLGITVSHTTDALKRKQFTLTHTTDSLKRTTNLKTHTTDSYLRKGGTLIHTTDANKRRSYTVTHTTDSNKKKIGNLVSHTTDANKKKTGLTVAHTTDALKRKQFTKTHTTDALKRTLNTKTHTTDALKRGQYTKVHTTDANKRKALVVTHTTDANKKKIGLLVTHTTDANKRKAGLTRTHTTDALLRQTHTLTHTTDSLKRKATLVSHTADAFKRSGFMQNHNTDANKRKVTLVSHTTDSNKKKIGNLVSHTTDSLKRQQFIKTHTTDALKRKATVVAHTTDALLRKQFTKAHTTDSLKRKQNVVTHTTDSLKRKQNVRTHTTDANKKKPGLTVFHTTSANLKKAGLLKTHTTDANKRKALTATHTTDANKKKAGNLVSHTTDANKKKVGNVKAHTTDALLRKQFTKTHTTDSMKRGAYIRTHTTDANKKRSYTVSHTTSSFVHGANTLVHTTDANKKKTGNTVFHKTDASKKILHTVSHLTDALLRVAHTILHTTSANKRRAGTVSHLTDALRRKANTISHLTDALKRKQFTKVHTTDANKRRAGAVSHTTDANKKASGSVNHTTDALKKQRFAVSHSTDAFLRRAITTYHTTDSNKKRGQSASHTTDALILGANYLQHTTDAFLFARRGNKKVLINGVWQYGVVKVLVGGVWVVTPVYYFDGSGWVLTQQ